MTHKKIPNEIKEQILERVKDGVSVADAAKDHGVSIKTIYGWLSNSSDRSVSLLEHNKLKRERDDLLKIVGELTHRLSKGEKNNPRARII